MQPDQMQKIDEIGSQVTLLEVKAARSKCWLILQHPVPPSDKSTGKRKMKGVRSHATQYRSKSTDEVVWIY